MQDEINIAWNQKNTASRESQRLIIPLLYQDSKIREDLQTLQLISFLPPKSYETAFEELLIALENFALQPSSNTKTSKPHLPVTPPAASPQKYLSTITRRTLLFAASGLFLLGTGFGSWELIQLTKTQKPTTTEPWICKYTMHTTPVWSVAWSPDAQLIASVEPGKDTNNVATTRVWHPENSKWEDIHIYRLPNGLIDQIAWSPNGQFLAGASRDGKAYVWDTRMRNADPVQ